MTALLVRTAMVYMLVIFSMRLMGKRQLGELQPTELVSTLLISNLASICIEDTVQPLTASIVPVLLIAVVEVFNSLLTYRHPGYARMLVGKPVAVIRDGQVDQQALAQLRISAQDLIEALRGKDVFDPRDARLALVETDGSLTVYPSAPQGRPGPMLPLVVDGCILHDNLALCGYSEAWLRGRLGGAHTPLREVFLLLGNGQESMLIQKAGKGKAVGS